MSVLNVPIFSPFIFDTAKETPSSGSPVSASVFKILIPESGLFSNVTTVGTFVFTSTVFGVSSRMYPSGAFVSLTTYQSGSSVGSRMVPVLSVVYSPTCSPFCFSTANFAPTSGSPLMESTFLMTRDVIFLLVNSNV